MQCVHQSYANAWLRKTAASPQAGGKLLLRCPFQSICCEGLCWTAEQENILQPNSHKQDWCLQPRHLTLTSRAWEESFGFIELCWGFDGIVFATMFSLPVASYYRRRRQRNGRIRGKLVLLARELRYEVLLTLRQHNDCSWEQSFGRLSSAELRCLNYLWATNK